MASSYDVHEQDGSVTPWDIPLYVIHGENDELFPVDTTQAWVDAANSVGYIVADRYQNVVGGNKIWRRAFSEVTSAGFSYGFSAQQTNDKGYIVVGYSKINCYDSTSSFGVRTESNMYLMKLDSNGTELWIKTYGGTGEESFNFVQ